MVFLEKFRIFYSSKNKIKKLSIQNFFCFNFFRNIKTFDFVDFLTPTASSLFSIENFILISKTARPWDSVAIASSFSLKRTRAGDPRRLRSLSSSSLKIAVQAIFLTQITLKGGVMSPYEVQVQQSLQVFKPVKRLSQSMKLFRTCRDYQKLLGRIGNKCDYNLSSRIL